MTAASDGTNREGDTNEEASSHDGPVEQTDDASEEPTRTTTHRPGDDVVHPNAGRRSWSWRGDLLLVVAFFALIVAPLLVYLRPPALEWRVRLLILPLLPGLLLAAIAVWATTRP